MNEDSMRDWPESLKISFESDRLAQMIYYCKNQIWPTDRKLWESLELSQATKNLYRAIAAQALMTCKPEPPKPNPGKPSTLHLVTTKI